MGYAYDFSGLCYKYLSMQKFYYIFLRRFSELKKGMLLIRLMLGLTFLIHGSQKVFGGFEAPIQMMQGLGLPAFLGVVLGLFEFVGGILMILGILSNYIALGFIITMLGALFTVHLAQGYMSSELVIILLVMSIAVTVSYQWKKFIEFY